jgi:hypothetical protein
MTKLSPLQFAQNELALYREHRRLAPSQYGNQPDGSMDGTPETGPAFAFAWDRHNRLKPQHYIFWSVHKHAWPLQFIYCFGNAVDSRGERTPETLLIDIRDLGEHIGTNRIARANWGSKSHLEVLSRALTEGALTQRILDATIPF